MIGKLIEFAQTIFSGYKFFSCCASCSTLVPSVSATCVCEGVCVCVCVCWGGWVGWREGNYMNSIYTYYISITIVQSYTGKYHEFVAVCIVTSVQHE